MLGEGDCVISAALIDLLSDACDASDCSVFIDTGSPR